MRTAHQGQGMGADLPDNIQVMIHVVVISAVAAEANDIKRVFLKKSLEIVKRKTVLWTVQQGNIKSLVKENRSQVENAQIGSNLNIHPLSNGQNQQNFQTCTETSSFSTQSRSYVNIRVSCKLGV